jgi:hypothetical protein
VDMTFPLDIFRKNGYTNGQNDRPSTRQKAWFSRFLALAGSSVLSRHIKFVGLLPRWISTVSQSRTAWDRRH